MAETSFLFHFDASPHYNWCVESTLSHANVIWIAAAQHLGGLLEPWCWLFTLALVCYQPQSVAAVEATIPPLDLINTYWQITSFQFNSKSGILFNVPCCATACPHGYYKSSRQPLWECICVHCACPVITYIKIWISVHHRAQMWVGAGGRFPFHLLNYGSSVQPKTVENTCERLSLISLCSRSAWRWGITLAHCCHMPLLPLWMLSFCCAHWNGA